MIRQFSKEREIAFVCDLHGHSRRKNIFMYGNNFDKMPHRTRVFPFIMSKLCDYFSFEYSRFSVHKSKEETARVTLWRELQIPCVYTLEASFCGADKGEIKDIHFSVAHLMLCGQRLLESLIVYTKIVVDPKKYPAKPIEESKERTADPTSDQGEEEEPKPAVLYTHLKLADIETELETNKKLIEITKGDEDGDDSAASDSEPSEDNLEEEEMAKIIPIKQKPKPVQVKKPEPKKKPEPPSIKKLSTTNRNIKGESSPTNKSAQKQPVPPRAPPSRSPMKRIMPQY